MTTEDTEFHDQVVAINFVADAGKLMLESSTSVSEVVERLRDSLPAVGLSGCSLDADMNSIILSHWQTDRPMPLTTMREVNLASPRLELLAGANRLLDQVQASQISLGEAADRLAALQEAKPLTGREGRLAMLLSVAGWVIFVGGLDVVTLAVALAATGVTFPVHGLVTRLRFPSLATTILIAVVVAAIPNLVAAAGVPVLVGPAVVGALFPHLPGRLFVSAVIDGLANASVSALSRGVKAMSVAGFLALGMLTGTSIGTGLGLTFEPNTATTPLLQSLLGAAIGVLGLAVAWSMPRRPLAATVAISGLGWLTVVLFEGRFIGIGDWPAYAIAAAVVGIAGAIAAALQDSSASVYTGVAVLPLAPGLSLYSGMLGFAQGDSGAAWEALTVAGVVSLAIAVGLAVGLALGRDAVDVAESPRLRRGGRRRSPPAGARPDADEADG